MSWNEKPAFGVMQAYGTGRVFYYTETKTLEEAHALAATKTAKGRKAWVLKGSWKGHMKPDLYFLIRPHDEHSHFCMPFTCLQAAKYENVELVGALNQPEAWIMAGYKVS